MQAVQRGDCADKGEERVGSATELAQQSTAASVQRGRAVRTFGLCPGEDVLDLFGEVNPACAWQGWTSALVVGACVFHLETGD